MTDFEYQVIQKLLEDKTLTLYERWVDDTLGRNKIADRQQIQDAFHEFNAAIRFTHETATVINRKLENGQTEKRRKFPSPSSSRNFLVSHIIAVSFNALW